MHYFCVQLPRSSLDVTAHDGFSYLVSLGGDRQDPWRSADLLGHAESVVEGRPRFRIGETGCGCIPRVELRRCARYRVSFVAVDMAGNLSPQSMSGEVAISGCSWTGPKPRRVRVVMVEVPLWQSRFVVPGAAVELFLAELEDAAISVAAFEEPADRSADGALWRVELIHRGEPDKQELTARLAPLAERAGIGRIDLTIAPLATTNWLARAAASFTPRRIGRFWVHGSHVRQAVPAGAVAIQLDAGLAFGSGEHESTQGCLLALADLARRRRFRRVLDVGCGSGILAIAAAKCWPAQVLAVDNDPDAVAVARANAQENGVAHRVRAAPSDGYRSAAVRGGRPYDLIFANILADPLCDMARDLARHLAPGGTAILAGLFELQAPRVIDAHRAVGLRLHRRIQLEIWTTLVFTRRRPHSAGRSASAERDRRESVAARSEPTRFA